MAVSRESGCSLLYMYPWLQVVLVISTINLIVFLAQGHYLLYIYLFFMCWMSMFGISTFLLVGALSMFSPSVLVLWCWVGSFQMLSNFSLFVFSLS